MADFKCPVVELEIVDHPDADRLEVARIGGFECVVGKDQYRTGDRAVYLPEASIVPEALLDELGLTGKLSGKDRNRVKAARLRGVVSQGLLVPLDSPHLAGAGKVRTGDDLREHLGIVKYVPPIPVHMAGMVEPGPSATFDVESWQAHVGVLASGEPVQITEKLHGTFCEMGFDFEHGPFVVSKGMAGKTRFKLDTPDNDKNLYVKAFREIADRLEQAAQAEGRSLALCGEIAGPRVQDMTYGLDSPTFFVFDALIGPAPEKNWLQPADVVGMAEALGVRHVPVIEAETPFDHETVLRIASEPSALGGGLREGVVVRPVEVRWDHSSNLGRVFLKYVNPKYLTRKGGTDHN